jgi:general secretion pathway protein I
MKEARSSAHTHGFTLIEVLLALSILAIALSAMLKASSNTVSGTQKIKDKTCAHFVAMQAISMIQLNLIPIHSGQTVDRQETLFKQIWYWHATIQSTPIRQVEKIIVEIRAQPQGAIIDTFMAYRTQQDA